MNEKRFHVSVLSLLWLALAGCGPAQPGLQLAPIPELDRLPDASPALRNAVAALDANKLDPDRNGKLGMLLDAHHLTAEAQSLYARARVLDPDSFRWTYLHGLALGRLGQKEAATQALRRALASRPGHPGAQLELARLTQAGGDADTAGALYSQLVERNPAYAQAHYAYGKFLFEQGETEAAIETLATALGLFNRYGQAHYTLALAYRELGQPGKAALHSKLFERYRQYQPPPYDTLLAQIASMNRSDAGDIEQAMSLVATGRAPEAVTKLEALAATSPASLTPRLPLIDIYGQLGQFAKAREHADIALNIDPLSSSLHDNIGVLQLRQGHNDEAALSFRRAIALDPDFAGLYKNLGVALEAAGRPDEALASFRTAVELDPFDSQSVYYLARALVEQKLPAQAVAVIEPITAFSHRETARYFQLLGRALADSGDWAAAAVALQRAIALANRYGMNEVAAEASAELDYVRRRAG